MTEHRAQVMDPRSLRLTGNNIPDLMPGEHVVIEIHRARSGNSHKHQFAWVNEAWQNLPEDAEGLPWAETPETLRKHALIATGWHDTYTIDCGSNAAGSRMKAHLIAAERRACGYAIGQLKGPILTVWTPKSQSLRAMGAKDFQKSKDDILQWIAAKVGVTPEELKRNG